MSLPGPRPSERDVEAMLSVIEARTVDFEPQRYQDMHRERLLAFLERRAQKQGLRELPPEAPTPEREEVPLANREGRGVVRAPEVMRGEMSESPARGSLRLRQQAAREVREVRERTPRQKPVGT